MGTVSWRTVINVCWTERGEGWQLNLSPFDNQVVYPTLHMRDLHLRARHLLQVTATMTVTPDFSFKSPTGPVHLILDLSGQESQLDPWASALGNLLHHLCPPLFLKKSFIAAQGLLRSGKDK